MYYMTYLLTDKTVVNSQEIFGPIALKLLSPRVTMTQCDPEPSR